MKKRIDDKSQMADVISVRLNDSSDPQRHEKFEDAIARGGATATNVMRAMADAYIDFVREHKRLPSFPLKIGEKNPPAK